MLYASVLNARSLLFRKRHGVMMRADLPVGKGGMKPPDNILVRILGARRRERPHDERDRESNRCFVEHYFLRVFGANPAERPLRRLR
jgi:hypothetical protein